ncbi:hypothetical protein HDU91_006799 [Kappamyces sp. JEL0680]|nr:hypothetical protein HDU91_006799 [Kappamyces sp. JEL0680]
MRGLFEPFRAIGFVTGAIPLSLQARGQTWFLTSAIGNSWMVFDAQTMQLKMVGGLSNTEDLSAICAHQDFTFCAIAHQIQVYSRQALIHTFYLDQNAGLEGSVEGVQVLGDLLLAFCDSQVFIYNHKTLEYYNEISTGLDFLITAMLHPSTYVNKILLASREGTMQLWNFKTMTMLYEFRSFGSPITALVQSPSIDVVAIGLLEGSVILYNIKLDREIMRFQQDGQVTAITFRTDGTTTMATANGSGNIALWDLSERRLVHLMETAHDASVHTCYFLNGTNILVTASSDNSIKQWIFDSSDGVPRLLKLRSGHHKPPTKIMYYGTDGRSLLSVGQDQSLRYYSVIRDAQNTELSQGR